MADAPKKRKWIQKAVGDVKGHPFRELVSHISARSRGRCLRDCLEGHACTLRLAAIEASNEPAPIAKALDLAKKTQRLG